MQPQQPITTQVARDYCFEQSQQTETKRLHLSVRVLVVDDHAVLRHGVIASLRSQTGYEIVGEGETAKEAVDQAMRFNPDIVLLDVILREDYGLCAASKIVRSCAGTKVVVFSASADPIHVRGMLAAGAAAYVLKTSDFTVVLLAIKASLSGSKFLDPALSGTLIEELNTFSPVGHKSRDILTPREAEVLNRTTCGYTNREISGELGITISSVNTYRIRVCEKLGLTSRAEMVRYGIAVGIMATSIRQGPPSSVSNLDASARSRIVGNAH